MIIYSFTNHISFQVSFSKIDDVVRSRSFLLSSPFHSEYIHLFTKYAALTYTKLNLLWVHPYPQSFLKRPIQVSSRNWSFWSIEKRFGTNLVNKSIHQSTYLLPNSFESIVTILFYTSYFGNIIFGFTNRFQNFSKTLKSFTTLWVVFTTLGPIYPAFLYNDTNCLLHL